MSVLLAALPPLAAALLLAVIVVMRFREVRRARRDDAVARHPSRRHPVPGLKVDGEPLTEDELREYTGIMFRSADQRGRRPQ